MAVYPNSFRPRAPTDLVRIGAAFDGGYVISSRILNSAKGLLSFGLSDEWEFEAEFSRLARVPVVCFDPTVNGAFWTRKLFAALGKGVLRGDARRLRRGMRFIDYRRFFDGERHRHIRKAIGYPGPRSLNLEDAMIEAALPKPVFLKMDIEGWEYRILSQLVVAQDDFVGLAIEFHDIDLHESRIVDFIQAISERFVLIHLHANNHTAIGPQGLALVAEMTFMARSLLSSDERLTEYDLPIAGLDAPNIPGKRDAVVSFAANG